MKIYFILLITNFLVSQNWIPYHNQEITKHQNDIIDYDSTDSIALTLINNDYFQRYSLSHDIIGYLPYWEYEQYPNIQYELISEINYFSAELDPIGNIINDHNWSNSNIVDFAHERGVKVKLCASLFGGNELTTLLSSETHRQNAINNLLTLVLNKNADGIDIDFELLPASQRDNLILFMQELSIAFHNNIENPIITMATPAIDWSNSWDYNMLAQITDGLFIMGYNYFYSGSSTAGPVSPLGGYFYDLGYTVFDYIDKTNGQFEKLILGLPYYGYNWPVSDSTMNSETIDNGNAIMYNNANLMSSQYGYNLDTISNAIWFSYQSNTWQQCWYDDSLSLSIKYQFAKDEELKGVGIWALGYDEGHDELWGSLYDQFHHDLFGDLNFDNIINVADVIILVNAVLNIEYINIADLNEDGTVNIHDVIILVNIILNS